MKVIAFYLPQFHTIPENNKWWGEGFTEWVNVKNAKPLFDGHLQPRVPLGQNYYDLADNSVMDWQIGLAKEYGVYGFCFYHYWFNGHLLLEKPVELFLKNKSQDIHFCLSWANEHWTNAWVSEKSTVLIAQQYGKEPEWEAHFNYLLDFFKDERYIKEDNKPLFVIYRPEIIDCLDDMLSFWNELAIQNGFSGMNYCYQHVGYYLKNKTNLGLFNYNIEYQPIYANSLMAQKKYPILRKIKRFISDVLETRFNKDIRFIADKKLVKYDYDKTWQFILNAKPTTEHSIPGAFVNWDNTPRRGSRGSVILGASPEKFYYYFSKLIKKAKHEYKTDMVFVFAWNEWAEGGFLEPDEKYGHSYLGAIKRALEDDRG